MLDSALYMWAAIERCSRDSTQTQAGVVQCEVDVASVATSVNGILKFILRAVEECSTMKTLDGTCAAEAFNLGQGISGVAKASGGIAQKCKNFGDEQADVNMARGRVAMCAVEVKNSMKSVTKASAAIMTIDNSCAASKWACMDNALAIISAFADLAAYVMGAVGHCSRVKFGSAVGCAAQINALVSELADVARASGRVNKLCKPNVSFPAPAREVAAPRNREPPVTFAMRGGGATLALAVLLPFVTALGFLGGARFGRHLPGVQASDEEYGTASPGNQAPTSMRCESYNRLPTS